MERFGWMAFLLIIALACNNQQTAEKGKEEETGAVTFAGKFRSIKVPYLLTDSILLENTDTARIANDAIKPYLPDSIINKAFGKGSKPKYVALGKVEVPKKETYYLVKGTAGNRKAILLLTFNNDNQYGATFPFLILDESANTVQSSSIDKVYTIYRNVTVRQKDDVVKEGKDVYVYNKDAGQFTLIMTDPIEEGKPELVNPIDTFSRINKWAGDYVKDKNNLVSVRDGRRPNEVRVFTHFEKEGGDCTGELRGDALLVSANTAVYRQGGDPCVLEFSFAASSVTLREREGCGSHRGVKCLFEGSYPRKKEKTKTDIKKPSKRKK